tara:strand:+ start:3891 stop:4664 length:774 start_codon:yes stop_codon:yes gene_type:complete
MFINRNFLKFFYNALLTGMPSLTYNPINKNVLHAPFIVNEFSTYINYRLNLDQLQTLKNYLHENTDGFNIVPSSILNDDSKDYFLSLNIYNCTSPIFSFIAEEPSTRCELNLYVSDKNEDKGTLIIDYVSNLLSLDPDNLFKQKGNINFNLENGVITGNADNENFSLELLYNPFMNIITQKQISSNLVKFTDKIFYRNGIYDKLYYDSSLIHNKIIDCKDYNIYFKFLDMEFLNVDNIFYFEKKINFVGGLWYNLLK